jgi:hypothetical protein
MGGVSDPLDCPSNEGCKPESMRGTPASRREKVSTIIPLLYLFLQKVIVSNFDIISYLDITYVI